MATIKNQRQAAKPEAGPQGKAGNCPTFAEYATDWLNNHKPPVLSKSTYVNYESMLNTINKTLGDIVLSEMTLWNLQEYYRKLREPDANRREAYAIARTLVSVMKERKLSNQKIADMSGVGASTVSAARKTGNHINIESAKKIAKGLDIPLEELFEVHSDTNGLSEKTIQNHHLFISVILEQAWRDGLVPYNIIGGRRRELD